MFCLEFCTDLQSEPNYDSEQQSKTISEVVVVLLVNHLLHAASSRIAGEQVQQQEEAGAPDPNVHCVAQQPQSHAGLLLLNLITKVVLLV